MKLTCHVINRSLVAAISGDIDHHSADTLRDRIEREFARADAKNIIFDFSEVSFMDSSGIGMVLGRYRALEKQGGAVAMAAIGPDIGRIFEMSGLQKLLPVYPNAKAAAIALEAHAGKRGDAKWS